MKKGRKCELHRHQLNVSSYLHMDVRKKKKKHFSWLLSRTYIGQACYNLSLHLLCKVKTNNFSQRF